MSSAAIRFTNYSYGEDINTFSTDNILPLAFNHTEVDPKIIFYQTSGDLTSKESGGIVNTIQTRLIQNIDRKHFNFSKTFKKQWDLNKASFHVFPYNKVEEITKRTFNSLLQKNLRDITFSFTSDNSIFFKASSKCLNYYLELFFDFDSDIFTESVLNTYNINGEIQGFSGSVEEVLSKIEKDTSIIPKLWFYPDEETLSPKFITSTQL